MHFIKFLNHSKLVGNTIRLTRHRKMSTFSNNSNKQQMFVVSGVWLGVLVMCGFTSNQTCNNIRSAF